MLGNFYPAWKSAKRQWVFGLILILGDGLASWGRPASPLGRSSGFARDSSILELLLQSACVHAGKRGKAQPKGNSINVTISDPTDSLNTSNDDAPIGLIVGVIFGVITFAVLVFVAVKMSQRKRSPERGYAA